MRTLNEGIGRLKILTLNHEFPPVGGGASGVTLELCKSLVRLGHRVDVVTMHYGDLPVSERIEGVNVCRTWAIRKRPDIGHLHELATYLPGALRTAVQLCRRNQYDIIHCHFMVPGAPLAWLVSRRTKIPMVVTCHGSDVPGHNPERFRLAHRALLPAWKFLARRCMIAAPSEYLRRLILTNCPEADVTVIPNGINDAFRPGSKEKRILLAGRIVQSKGFQYAIEALSGLPPEWKVDIAGDGTYLEELKSLAGRAGVAAVFHGWLDRSDAGLRELFAKSSIFVFPSEAENFPTVLLEAMSAGMAIITSNAGGCPEVVGEAAMLVPPRDPAAVRRCLDQLIQNPSLMEQLSAAGIERAARFSWQSTASRYVQFYQDSMRKRQK
ncbi:MAG TPA: glycosyltransferase family 4 protein [Sedimentisphaerales bacterium]|nr:glycosyltransferase family 4 protein [Sedimentisphaerales bacterium]